MFNLFILYIQDALKKFSYKKDFTFFQHTGINLFYFKAIKSIYVLYVIKYNIY